MHAAVQLSRDFTRSLWRWSGHSYNEAYRVRHRDASRKEQSMATRVGINGFGRIGRHGLPHDPRASRRRPQVVAINDLVDVDTNAHLLKYDSNYGRFDGEVEARRRRLVSRRQADPRLRRARPGAIPWGDADVEIVIESTGFFTDGEQAVGHRHDSVKKVIISAPATNEDKTIVLGVNDETYDPKTHHVISNASCTTNGLAPPVKVLVEEFGLIKGQMTTIHSYTNSQQILDRPAPRTCARPAAAPEHRADLDRRRAGSASRHPRGRGHPRWHGLPRADADRLGRRGRGLVNKKTSKDEVNSALRTGPSERMKGIMDITQDPVVSMDMKGNEHSSIIDGLMHQRRRRRPREGRLLVRQRVGLRLPPGRPDGHGGGKGLVIE